MTIGENLRRLRKERGITQTELAHYLGITFQQVQKYETGGNRISADRLFLIRKLFECEYDEFFKGM